ncbi:glycosyltransferase [Collibacillus ludicampi]|nr:glycosyltransferase [Collibacillus ludicampi]
MNELLQSHVHSSSFCFPDQENKSSESQIALVIHNITLFEVMEPLLKSSPFKIDIFLPGFVDPQWGSMVKATEEHLIRKGYHPRILQRIPDEVYKIVISSQLYPIMPKSECNVRFLYGLAKETWNFDVWNVNYDLILCYGPYDESFLSGYALTQKIGPIRFAEFKQVDKNRRVGKRRLLYLPTYGSACSIEHLEKEFKNIHDQYDITIRLHHGTLFLEPERVKIANRIGKVADYDRSLAELLQETDVVLSDGSGAIFDAIANDIPVVVFQPVPPEPFEGKPSLEQQIIYDNLVPHTNNASEIKKLLDCALTDEDYINKRKQLADRLFPIKGSESITRAWEAIIRLLDGFQTNSGNSLVRQRLRKKFQDMSEQIQVLKTSVEQKESAWKEQYTTMLSEFEKKIKELGRLKQELAQRDQLIQQLTQKIVDKEIQIKQFIESNTKKDEHINDLNDQLSKIKVQLNQMTEELLIIYSSNFWKIASKYYKLRDSNPFTRTIYKALRKWKRDGTRALIYKVYSELKARNKPLTESNTFLAIINTLVDRFNRGEISGIAVISAAFEFDELYNQRTINLAKFLAKNNYGVLYVAWQWKPDELQSKGYQEVYRNIFQIPKFDFISQIDLLNLFSVVSDKLYFITIPDHGFYGTIRLVRELGFSLIYDILDDWEEFGRVDQAPWYNKEIEEAVLVTSDLVVAVSEPLKSKFTHLRTDIHVVGNGYDPLLLKHGDISLKEPTGENKIHVGYFGHLTESWFDWDLVFNIVENNSNMVFHLIGYGASNEIQQEIRKKPNIRFYGKVPPNELHKYVKHWHIGIIPFIDSKLSQAVDPIKVYEYMFFGLPTIVTGIEHIKDYPGVFYCGNRMLVADAIKNMYAQTIREKRLNPERIAFLASTTWDARFRKLENLCKRTNYWQRIYRDEDECQ